MFLLHSEISLRALSVLMSGIYLCRGKALTRILKDKKKKLLSGSLLSPVIVVTLIICMFFTFIDDDPAYFSFLSSLVVLTQ